MRSKIAGILILILFVTAIVPRSVYCTDEDVESVQYTQASFQRLNDEGKAIKGSSDVIKNVKTSYFVLATGGGTIATIITFPLMVVQGIMALVVNGDFFDTMTIQELVLNQSDLFNANYTETSNNDFNNLIKDNVMKWFYALRNMAAVLSFLILICTAIRMAISSVASEKAKYKNMIVDWVVSFAVIFLIQYIIVFAMAISDTIVELFGAFNVESFEKNLAFDVLLPRTTLWTYVAIVIMYIVVVYYQFKFFLIYSRRFLAIGFLVIISPLITITYPIDRAKDGKSQVLNAWFREFLGNMYIQPLHAGIYTVFIVSANEIFKLAPILSIVLFIMIARAEKIMKNIFGLKKITSIKDMEEVFKR